MRVLGVPLWTTRAAPSCAWMTAPQSWHELLSTRVVPEDRRNTKDLLGNIIHSLSTPDHPCWQRYIPTKQIISGYTSPPSRAYPGIHPRTICERLGPTRRLLRAPPTPLSSPSGRPRSSGRPAAPSYSSCMNQAIWCTRAHAPLPKYDTHIAPPLYDIHI